MGYGYSYGYGYGSGYGYSYGYSSPPPPPTPISPSPPVLPPPPCPSLSKPASPPPPVPDSASPPPSSPPPVPVPSSPLPPVPSSPPPASYPPPVPSSPPPPVPVSQPPLASPPLVPSSSPPFKTVKPHVELYYSPPPPIQPASPPPALPPVSTEPYMSPPPPPLAPSAPPPLPKSPPPLAPKSLPPVSKSPSPLAPKSPPPVSASPPLAPTASPPVSSPVTSPVPPPSSNPYTPPAPVATYTPPPPKRLPYFSPPPPKAPTRPGAVNPNANNTSQNIVISREAAAAIVVVAGLVTLSFVGAAFWFVKQRRRPETEEPIRHMRNFMPSPTVGSQFSEATSAAGPSGSRGTFPFPPRPPSTTHTHNPYSPSDPNLPPSKQYFTYADLLTFTSNFAPSHLLGEGGFGCVYSGVLPDGRRVAVKKLRESGGQGDREFKTEVDIISRVHHRHLVSLVGCCVDEGERLLVYDYVDNDTLYYHLHRNGGTVLSWSLRVKIAAGAARGIAYLHEDCHPRIIHRDIKSSNILIDNNFEAQVSDFGLARLAMDANSQVTTRVMGTFGYLAPEYALSGKLTAKSDVYSFGVVLLELITGRKPVDSSQPLGDESLVEWAKPYLVQALENRDFGELPDPRLEGKYDETEMHRMIEAAAACVRHSSSMRPRMAQVVRALDSLVSDTNLTNGIPPGQSEIFEPQTEEIRMFQMREFGDCSSELSQVSSRRQRDL